MSAHVGVSSLVGDTLGLALWGWLDIDISGVPGIVGPRPDGHVVAAIVPYYRVT
jgi:hypothetical protein